MTRQRVFRGAGLIAIVLVLMQAQPATGNTSSLGSAADFAMLGLNGGKVVVNSATKIVGDFGYSSLVDSTKNQKATDFTGTVYVHSLANFSYNSSNFTPSGGIMLGSSVPGVDAKLNQANADALAASALFAALGSTHVLGALGDNDNRVVNSVGPFNIISLSSLDYKSDTLELVSRPGFDDVFIFNVLGDFEFSQSTIKLTGVSPGNVLFNFPNASSIDINKSSSTFYGTILAPLGTVEYHNPATFEGAIIAYDIDLHSDFNLIHRPFVGVIPEPVTVTGVVAGVCSLGVYLRRRGRILQVA